MSSQVTSGKAPGSIRLTGACCGTSCSALSSQASAHTAGYPRDRPPCTASPHHCRDGTRCGTIARPGFHASGSLVCTIFASGRLATCPRRPEDIVPVQSSSAWSAASASSGRCCPRGVSLWGGGRELCQCVDRVSGVHGRPGGCYYVPRPLFRVATASNDSMYEYLLLRRLIV